MPARVSPLHPVVRLRFRQAPLAAAAVWFGVGLVVARWQAGRDVTLPAVELLGALGLLVGLAGCALRWAERVAWLPVMAVWLVLGLAASGWTPSGAAGVELAPFADNLNRRVEAHVVRIRLPAQAAATVDDRADRDEVHPWEATEDAGEANTRRAAVSVDLAVDRLEEVTPDVARMVAAQGGVRVTLYGAGPALRCGDRVELPLRLKLPVRYRDAGVYQYADRLLAEGIVARGSAAWAGVRVVGASPASWTCRLGEAQGWASGRLMQYAGSPENRRLPAWLRVGEPDARMLGAMLFGDRTGLNHSLRRGFERTGSFHLFVVSGMHIALLAGGVYWLLRRVRLPVWAATGGTLAATAAYAGLTGFGQPAQRALGMVAVFLLARLLGREHDRAPLNALGAAALLMLVWAPSSAFEASFQMTVLAIVAIAGIAIPLGGWTFLRWLPVTREVFARRKDERTARELQLLVTLEAWGEELPGRLKRWPAGLVRGGLMAAELALIGLVAELVMVLPMAMYFHRAAVYALPANLFVVPLIALLAPVAVLFFVCSLVSPWAALVPGAVTALLLHGITAGVRGVSRLGGADVRVPGPVWWVAAAVLVGFGVCCWLVRRSRAGALAAAVLVPVLAGVALWPERAVARPGRLEVTAIDVGQGDGLLAVNPDGDTMVIDAGGPTGAGGQAEVVRSFDVGEEVVSPYLWSRRVRRVGIVVLTHAHTDHMGGMPAVLENFRPRELWVGAEEPRSVLYQALLAQAARLGVKVRRVRAGDRIAWGPVAVTVMAPALWYHNGDAPQNDDSVVLRMQYGAGSAMLEGDAEKGAEAGMVAWGFRPVTLLKVGHHGSGTSTTEAFLRMARPKEAVISDGKGNTFGHPKWEVLERLQAAGVRTFRTDEDGEVTFWIGKDGGIESRTGD